MELWAHPFSSYCQKVLTALYENGTPFTFRLLEGDADMASLKALWPFGKFPVLVDGERTIGEASAIIEHLQVRHPGPVRLIPADSDQAVEVRMLDRVFDNYVMSPQQKIVFDALRPEASRNAQDVADARATLDIAYDWLEARLANREWAAADAFSLADCGASPALFYADWTHAIGDRPALQAYRRRLLARPSFARAVDEARPYRQYFPLGAPDRD